MTHLTLAVCLSVLWLALPPVPVNARSAATSRAETPADYPRRPVRLLVPFAPGGGTDIIARLTAQNYAGVTDAQIHSMLVENPRLLLPF